MSQAMLQQASNYAKKALKLDQARRYKEAITNYLNAATVLQKLIGLEQSKDMRNLYYRKAREYLARATELKEIAKKPVSVDSEADKSEDEIEAAIEETIVGEKPNVAWDDVAGLVAAKSALREAIILPMVRPDLFKGARKPWKGIMLFGPPGCGKTLIAKAVATECDATFFNVSAAAIISKWLGESEKLVRELFEAAKEKMPSLVFIDEVDSIATERAAGEHDALRRVKTQLMQAMDGVTSKAEDRIVVLGATNIPWEIDAAFRRRFEKRIYVPLPDLEARQAIFKIHTKGVEHAPEVNFEELAMLSEGYSGADIALICREAIMMPVRELDAAGALTDTSVQVRHVAKGDFTLAMEKIRPSVSSGELLRFDEWFAEFGAD
ncbi:AAA family ATPase [Candidatus Borrarchaeum sp.]|uniref:AAA family ATPase n=1 Tax=Candidatus Borrarchaeum sp. TaxID=2846742 RepID=UPI00257FEBDF|nr:AAA family ATPase [Candidatus Borrarchaeum sp.]